jgi:uncharacterized protein
MKDRVVCPFYGKSDDLCDVGCGYISPHDVNMIIKYCSTHHTECMKFRELEERYPVLLAAAVREANEATTGEPAVWKGPQGPPEVKPFRINWPLPFLLHWVSAFNSQTFNQQKETNTMANQNVQVSSSALALHDTTANPAPLGLLGFGMTTVLLNLHNAGFFGLDAMILGMGIFYGGLGQILVGIMEWKKNNTFGATAFTSYGLFWLSLVALIVLPKTGFGAAPQASAMTAYLAMWGLFSAVLFIGTFRLNKALVFVFGSLTILFGLLVAAEATGNPMLKTIAGYEGIVCGLSAIYTGMAQVMNEVYGRTVAPLGDLKKAA